MNRKQLHKRVTELQMLMEKGYVRFERPNPIQESVQKIRFDKKGNIVPESVDQNVTALLTLVELY
ncbi:hypothetical protein GCM10007416_30250 [Kroppenstedtia guangzhouensis]|jgi:hypothetical protein|uniref:Uncharacterized protein n=1 Tax=Kroppenstedtia guangzhouensis TaxID=1274356 RepID=A0ABQ1H1E7_9BACL|nr:hypothetical protein [Kroppenstedtia guangzhouensis]GGA54976.1 hypothetical protein GCM10007416_30250 [Kroppenstedtia guangzhouensis]